MDEKYTKGPINSIFKVGRVSLLLGVWDYNGMDKGHGSVVGI